MLHRKDFISIISTQEECTVQASQIRFLALNQCLYFKDDLMSVVTSLVILIIKYIMYLNNKVNEVHINNKVHKVHIKYVYCIPWSLREHLLPNYKIILLISV